MMYFNSLSQLLLNSGGRNSDSAWSKMYDLIPRSSKSHKFGENYQESDFQAENGHHSEKWPQTALTNMFFTLSASVILVIIVIRK